jgi:hypothetical protein
MDTWTVVEADRTKSSLGEKPDAPDPGNCIIPVRAQLSSEKIKGQIQKPITGLPFPLSHTDDPKMV